MNAQRVTNEGRTGDRRGRPTPYWQVPKHNG